MTTLQKQWTKIRNALRAKGFKPTHEPLDGIQWFKKRDFTVEIQDGESWGDTPAEPWDLNLYRGLSADVPADEDHCVAFLREKEFNDILKAIAGHTFLPEV